MAAPGRERIDMDLRELTATAELARIRLKEGDIERLGAEVERMLAYFETMKNFDVSGLEPTTHALIRGNQVRPDSAEAASGGGYADALLEQAPDLEGRLIVIPNVL
jgi:aspartyl-tRNA(Asn)/glutamyl-tRNA(Gln) amidotransferase subunit C